MSVTVLINLEVLEKSQSDEFAVVNRRCGNATNPHSNASDKGRLRACITAAEICLSGTLADRRCSALATGSGAARDRATICPFFVSSCGDMMLSGLTGSGLFCEYARFD